MGAYKVFSSNNLTSLFYIVYLWFILNLKETTNNITAHILNYNSSFLLDMRDNFSFIVSKRLNHTSFKTNVVNFSSALPPDLPPIPRMGSQCPLTPQLPIPHLPSPQLPILVSKLAKRIFFFLPG